MKKIFLILQNKDLTEGLSILRNVGTLHVENQEVPAGAQLNTLKDEIKDCEKILNILGQNKNPGEQIKAERWRETIQEILGLTQQIDRLNSSISKRSVQIKIWEPWGDFDPKTIKSLEKSGIYVRLYEIPVKGWSKIPEEVVVEKIFTSAGIDRCVVISRDDIELPFNEVSCPRQGLNTLKQLQEEEEKTKNESLEKLARASQYKNSLRNALEELKGELKFQEIYGGVGNDEDLIYLKGYCPAEQVHQIEQKAKTEHWGLMVDDPNEDDQIPTLTKNPKWVELIKPVFDFINIMPGYKEFDISVFFLLFLSVFVGILIGDAGYGLLFILTTVVAQIALRKKVQDHKPFLLVYLFSGCTIAWGMLTGTFFGQQWIPQGTISPILPWLTDNNNVQMFCFLVGAIHLSIAHIWRAVIKFPNASFLGDVGWLSLVWGMFFVAKLLILGIALPEPSKLLFLIGPFLVIFFTQPNKNPLKAIGPGIGDFLLNVINTFTDVVSYIRLFAVGLATVAVADATNTFALGIGFTSLQAGIASSIILLIGHSINIILAIMAILVHGLRLNVLEFSGHLNMEWTGVKYDPFRRVRQAS